MKKFKKLWRAFAYDRSRNERLEILLSVLSAILAFVLMFFVPTTTIGQWIIVSIFATVVVSTFYYHFTSEEWDTYIPDTIIISGYCILVTVILWIFNISVFWSLIPLGIIFFILTNANSEKLDILSTVAWLIIFAFWFISIQSNLNAKKYLKEDPVPEVVVLSNYDDRSKVFFIEEQDKHLKLSGIKVQNRAFELNLKKGDTVQIVRHPNDSTLVIKISK